MRTDVNAIISGTATGDPFEHYEALRAEHQDIFWDAGMNAWIVLTFELGREVFRDDVSFAHPYPTMRSSEWIKKIRKNNPRTLQLLHGEPHRALHKWWLLDLLGPRWVRQYETTTVDPTVKRLVTRLQGRTSVELADEYCEKVPVSIFASLMGLADLGEDEVSHIKRQNEALARFTSAQNAMKYERDDVDPADHRLAEEAVQAGAELERIFMPRILAKRENRGEDFVSRLWAGGPQVFPDWNELDMLDACIRLMFAGSDTTTHTIANAIHRLLEDPALMERMRSDDAAIVDRFTDEVLRMEGSVHFRPRRATKDMQLGRVTVKQGDLVYVLLLAANRDPAQYACPHAFDMARKNPQNHLSFIVGPRSCPGQTLARAEITSAVRNLLAAFPRLRPDREKPAAAYGGGVLKSHRPLWARLD